MCARKPKSRRGVLLLAVSSMLGMALAAIVAPWHPGGDVANPKAWVCGLVFLYLPALGMTLWPVAARAARQMQSGADSP